MRRLIGSTPLTSPTYTIHTTKSWSPTTDYELSAILKVTTNARSYLITSDRSYVAFYKVKMIVTHDCRITILAAVS